MRAIVATHVASAAARLATEARAAASKLLIFDGDRYGLFHDRFRDFLIGPRKDPIAQALADQEAD